MFDLSTALGRELLADKVKADIDEYCRVTYDDGPRKHLGASLLAHPCAMYKWLVFRWACEERFDGRMQRLFNRGHREEERWCEWLRGNGWTVNEYSPQVLHWHAESETYFYAPTFDASGGQVEDVTQDVFHVAAATRIGVKPPQIRIKFAEGHGGGSLDAELSHPEVMGGETLLGEFKTYNEKQFAKLTDKKKGGVQLAKPQHWGQMCSYGFARKIRYALYFSICKNDDAIHVECKELNWRLGEQLMQEGEQIIVSQLPPPRLSDNPQWRDCLYCGKYRVCHGGERVDINCRSCRHASPAVGGKWNCAFYNMEIPPDFIPKGCSNHFPILG